jgi:hypothetical protein
MATLLTIPQVLMGRDSEFPLTGQMWANLAELLRRVNPLIHRYGRDVTVNSGYRPGPYNKRAGGSKTSPHLTCEAVDIADPEGLLAKWLTPELLEQYDLYMEDPEYTKGWVHLQTRKTRSGKRIFKP